MALGSWISRRRYEGRDSPAAKTSNAHRHSAPPRYSLRLPHVSQNVASQSNGGTSINFRLQLIFRRRMFPNGVPNDNYHEKAKTITKKQRSKHTLQHPSPPSPRRRQESDTARHLAPPQHFALFAQRRPSPCTTTTTKTSLSLSYKQGFAPK
ncbi:hypothetical protein PC9H_005598 [Pleurotus ostreatus]|uniref:Uncharacterized protein n=1 Tax=Pleurotus ostreatus TaxID=5322 RepID=A0A8H7A466_PLEOS|nr:uncharacterized protein PC9H_005598 [Pleurotus ostreatus]KAF7433637.1 hypothetical protein PC9H_005598 [Pleurotus ostreatus]